MVVVSAEALIVGDVEIAVRANVNSKRAGFAGFGVYGEGEDLADSVAPVYPEDLGGVVAVAEVGDVEIDVAVRCEDHAVGRVVFFREQHADLGPGRSTASRNRTPQ